MKPILSICIPTYNRYASLKDCIEDTIPELITRNVEICISNNASSDKTHEYLIHLCSKYRKIKYNLQPFNRGIDQNMINVIKMASSDFILPMGDDDKIIINNIDYLIENLSKNLDLIILNGYKNKKKHLSENLASSHFDNPNEAFIKLWDKMPFGAFAFNRNLINQAYFSKYLNTSHAYTGFIWESLADKFIKSEKVNIKCLPYPIIMFKDEIKTWRNNTFKIMFYEIPLWFNLLKEKYPVIITNEIYKRYLNSLSITKVLLKYKLNGFLTKQNIILYMPFFSQKQIKRAKRISRIPLFIIKDCYVIYINIKNFING